MSKKVAIINDTHLGVKNGSDIFLNNLETFYSKIFFPYCDEHGIDTIFHLGDYFDHRKYVNYKVLDFDRKNFLNEAFNVRDMKMFLIPGNHDTYFKQSNDLNSLDLILGDIKNIEILQKPVTLNFNGTDIDFIPWMCADNEKQIWEFIANSRSKILMGHLELAGFKMLKGVSSESHGYDPQLLAKYEMVFSGHYHTKSQKDNIYYLGTQVELTWADADDPKYFHVFDTETLELTPVRNTHSLFNRIYYDEDNICKLAKNKIKGTYVKVIISNRKDYYAFDQFIDKIQSYEPQEIKIVEKFDEYIGENVSDDEISTEDTMTLLNTYVDSIETQLDKDTIKNALSTLYVEAQNDDNI